MGNLNPKCYFLHFVSLLKEKLNFSDYFQNKLAISGCVCHPETKLLIRYIIRTELDPKPSWIRNLHGSGHVGCSTAACRQVEDCGVADGLLCVSAEEPGGGGGQLQPWVWQALHG